MNNETIYIPSTVPGKHWNLYTHKPQGRPAIAVAVEGELETNDGRMTCFKTTWPGSRTMRLQIAGVATVKRKALAIEELKIMLQDAGAIQ